VHSCLVLLPGIFILTFQEANRTSFPVPPVKNDLCLFVICQVPNRPKLEWPHLKATKSAQRVVHQVQHLVLQHILRAGRTIAWYPSVTVTKAVLVHLFRDKRVQIGGGVEHVGHVDLVSGALGVTFSAKF
jgi:hypothetical protein